MSTIAAISSAPANGGIGIIRISGKDCFKILEKIFIPKQKQNIDEIPGYTIKYGHIIDLKTKEKIDEVLVSFFKEPKSYTTENMCEINSHGGVVVEQKILEQCLLAGANMAEPGEFTKRAFLNGRIDLSQAEGIIDLINAKTDLEAKASFKQLEGGLSNKIKEIRKDILDMLADIEASIDYPEYDDIPEITNKKVIEQIIKIKEKLKKLEKSFDSGKVLKEGIRTVILGKPNVGKSSLLNAILKEDRAIVSQIEGTTRDTIEEMVQIHGIPLKLIDTAGIRNAKDEIEQIGVNKALKISEEADLILCIFDNSQELEEEDIKILNIIKNKNAIILLNKTDIKECKLEENEKIKSTNKPIIKISAKTKTGIEEVYKQIENMFRINEININNGEIITNIRHKNQIIKAINTMDEAIKSIKINMPIDIIAVSIKDALEELSVITGENVSEDILNNIFSKFCLGK